MEKIVSGTTIGQGLRGAILVPGTTWEVRDVWKDMMLIEANQTPFINYAFMNGRVKWTTTANAQGKFEFPEMELVPTMCKVTTVDGGTGTHTLQITPDQPNMFRVGKRILFVETGETGTVTVADTTHFHALRDYATTSADTAWTTPSVNSKIQVIGSAEGDKHTPPTGGIYSTPYMRAGRVQLFQESMSMTDMMRASTKNGGTYGGDWWSTYMRNKAREMKRDMSLAAWFNPNHQLVDSTLYGSTEVITTSEGIIYQIEHNGGFNDTYGNGALTKTAMNNFLRMSKKGSAKKTWFVGDGLMGQIEDIIDEKYYNTKAVARYGPIAGDDIINVVTIRVFNLVVDIIREPLFEEGTKWYDGGVLLDDNYVTGCSFVNDDKGTRKWRLEQAIQANGQPYELAQYLAHVGWGISCAPYHGTFYR